ncbi:unnamed protein product [Adineta steineri]|uniref:DOMON domain-containing protein n=1 Tax=Adineta steineri TaxID=433720 RepID=A0A815H974_9BILA|nr:unnamed protein product [Adineta steineri]
MFVYFVSFLSIIHVSNGLSSPLTTFTTYQHSVELQSTVADLWWTVNETNQTIFFELHVNTTGWIALGISPAGGMTGADIGVGWVDQSGKVTFQDRYAYTFALPVRDNTTVDWFATQGREQNGWTAIQFHRLLDTCDYMDVAIKSGTNTLIFAYGLVDPSAATSNDITYHETRRGSYTLSLRSYDDPPPESKFAGMNYFDFQTKNYSIPLAATTYLCTVYKAPAIYTTKQHVIAQKIVLNSTNPAIVHHLLMYECDPTTQFNDSNLPNDLCENLLNKLSKCLANIATGWAVGGDFMSEFPPEAGYPVGGNFSIKYYVLQIHYSNSIGCTNCVDNSGIRFYVTDQLRPNDIGYLTFGTDTSSTSLTIPPGVQSFAVDSYCPMNASLLFPTSGITVLTAFPHAHLQGVSIWTKLIRNKTVVEYLFDAEVFDFNYQFINQLPQRIQLYPGDEFATRCMYNTMNKNITTFGGESTTNEMCLHMFTYYPRVNNLYGCITVLSPTSWANFLKMNSTYNSTAVEQIAANITWTTNLRTQWQNFYNNASRVTVYGTSGNMSRIFLPKIPYYADLAQENCTVQKYDSPISGACIGNLIIWQILLISIVFVLFSNKNHH